MRKFWLGVIFMFVSGFVTYASLTGTHEPDLVGLATVIGAIAGGVLGVVWGNVKEHQSKVGNGTP
jgi:outer membrane lipoprotein SlyB